VRDRAEDRARVLPKQEGHARKDELAQGSGRREDRRTV
jgi:hypothetical protein